MADIFAGVHGSAKLKNSRKDRALLSSCWSTNVEYVRRLISQGANVNWANERGETPLHIAAWGGAVDLAKLLIHNGADASRRTKEGQQAIHIACDDNCVELVELLLRGAAVDVNSSGPAGWTPLHYAAYNGEIAVVLLLLKYNANSLLTNEKGQAPIHLATIHKRESAMQVLFHRNDIALNLADRQGWTPLHYAADDGAPAIVIYLLDIGADPTLLDAKGRAPIHLACMNDEIATVRAFLRYGGSALVNLRSSEGWMPLDFAIRFGATKVEQFLRKHGADQNLTGNLRLPWTDELIIPLMERRNDPLLTLASYTVDTPNSTSTPTFDDIGALTSADLKSPKKSAEKWRLRTSSTFRVFNFVT